MSEKIIAWGVIGLLMYTPLGFGGAELTVFLLEFGSGALFCVWLANTLRRRRHHPPKPIFPAFLGIAGIFGGWLLLQLLPLPGWLVNLISPNAYRLAAEAAATTATAIPAWLTLSICPAATAWEFSQFLAYGALFVTLINTFRSSGQIKRLAFVISMVGFGESIYGFSQLAGQEHWQVVGTFVNRNHFAGYLEMAIPLTFGLVLLCLEQARAVPLKKFVQLFEERYLQALLLLFVALVMICALLLTGSRGGIVSFTLGMSFLGLLAYTRRLLRKWALALALFVLLALGSGILLRPEMTLRQLSALAKPTTEGSFQFRWEIWRSTLAILRDFPISGTGCGTFAHIFRRYQQFPADLFFTHAENDYLQLAAETGVIGTLLLLGAGGLGFYRLTTAWRRQRSRWAVTLGTGLLSALFSLMLHSGVDFNLHIPANALLFTVIAAMCYGAAHAPQPKSDRRRAAGSTAGRSHKRGRRIVLLALAGLYLGYVAQSYYAFAAYQDFMAGVAHLNQQTREGGTPPARLMEQHAQLRRSAQTALRAERHSAEYAYALGSYLYWYYAEKRPAAPADQRQQGLQEAEAWLQQAVRRDPANPWYIYELGRLSLSQGSCEDPGQLSACSTTRYFQAALQNAPLNLFLRAQVGLWTYRFDQPQAFRLVQEIAAQDAQTTGALLEGLWSQLQDYHLLKKFLPETPAVAVEFSKFLYAKRLDYESDLETARALPVEKRAAGRCQVNFTIQQPDVIELGNDDGTAEWRTYLSHETFRAKKVLCLPENVADYKYAALRIYMNNGGSADFVARIMLDDHLLWQYARTLADKMEWHDIPFEVSFLAGKASVNVYIRVAEATAAGNYLILWGDRDVPTTTSLFNLATTEDLSYDPGVQTGEYLIRLVLRKS